jgi:hypothetical protein
VSGLSNVLSAFGLTAMDNEPLELGVLNLLCLTYLHLGLIMCKILAQTWEGCEILSLLVAKVLAYRQSNFRVVHNFTCDLFIFGVFKCFK